MLSACPPPPLQSACKFVTVLLHYFFLATFTWTLCEAVLIYNLLKAVFGANNRKWIYIYLTLGWGMPMHRIICIVCQLEMGDYISSLVTTRECYHTLFVGMVLFVSIPHIELYTCNVPLTPSTFSLVHLYIALPIPIVVISAASRHNYYLIRYSFDEGSPHYNQVKA